MAKPADYIGVFDSGVGGISVLKELVRLMPQENYLYFGDSANAPYGEKSTEDVRKLTLQNAQELFDRGCKGLVIACNTATAAAIDALRQMYPDKLIIGIEPALKPAADQFPAGRIGIMATQVTLREDKFSYLLERFPGVTVEKIPAPGLVELIEQGKTHSEETTALLQSILTPYMGNLDALVLGCTHYPFVKDSIAKILPIALFDGGDGTARQTQRLLEQNNLLNPGQGSVILENSLGTQEILNLCHKLLTE